MLNGHLLNDRYQIEKTIGGGGMANVYLARDTILQRDVAIKVLRLDYANDEEFLARFDREAQSATSLSHPNIVNIYDIGEEDQISYMVMEYVDGMTLKEYIQNYGPIEVQEALDIMKQITAAIAHAHANDIVHRDIKPQNILIDTYGQVKVTDFGIAIALSATSFTQTNSILGSVHYLSPEQARGGMATKKSDIYSIGIVLFELLTGRLPFSGQSPVSIALKHLQSDTPSVKRFNPNVPQSVENVVLKATAKDPFHRYDTVDDTEEAIVTALDPSNINEAVYTPPVEAGEETKAIPIITDNQMDQNPDQDTMVHQSTDGTNPSPTDEQAMEKSKKELKKEKKKSKKKSKKKRKKKWILISVILFVLLASGLFVFFLLQPSDVSVPDVTEMEYEEAEEELESLNLDVDMELIYSEDVESGLVVRSNPRAGRTIKEGSTVTLFVSEGSEPEVFDDYVGRDYSQVKILLEEAGYEVNNYERHSDRPVDEIVNQIQPSPDSEVVPSETSVIFETSMGPELVRLNNLRGMTEEDARNYLEDNNLTMNTIEQNSDNIPEGEVVSQDPETDSELEEGSTVDVYISIGPEALPPESHTITYTVPYSPEESEDEEDADEESEDADEEPQEQTVRIYIDDMNNDISEVSEEETITEDTEFTFTLTIAPNNDAEYRIIRDDDEITNQTVSYEEGE
ncbi:serine/threonine-protein kinase [Virgibacillus natechei]|uniref:non-specific serine/threonine protein kinase n=1 Tax=Virgibacillus natechei TaxID=1216297 RepID=A0ABS4IB39_9BACI|nr:Stk1 family PASTA domain-containing Ser/Thr kinase [Virgibacillus natechei]MBP1968148.1 serine/threonine-protein kinase [Virgibacillus natechei]UZD14575.1 Stk1 family PASTA domain-containing Ser/Thr kinase [Virgibacillus natechei]